MSNSKFYTLEELKKDDIKFFKIEDMPVYNDNWSAADVGITSPLQLACFAEGISILRGVEPKGFHFQSHSHPHKQIAVIIEGAIEYTVEDQTQLLKAGDVVYIPSNASHSGKAIEDTVMLDICCPAREDHLSWYYPEVKAKHYHEEAGDK